MRQQIRELPRSLARIFWTICSRNYADLNFIANSPFPGALLENRSSLLMIKMMAQLPISKPLAPLIAIDSNGHLG
jgi:hypothetical protein